MTRYRLRMMRRGLEKVCVLFTATLVCCVVGCRPVVLIMSPDNNDRFSKTDEIFLRCVAFSPDYTTVPADALSWKSDRDGELGQGKQLKVSGLSPGLHTITARATGKDNRHAYASVRISVIGNMSPIAFIEMPENGASFTSGDEIRFKGRGYDPDASQNDNLSLQWESSIDGIIGTGNAVVRADMSEGNHRITLTVTDGEGAQGRTRCTVNVSGTVPAATTTVPVVPTSTTTTARVTTTTTVATTSTTTTVSHWQAVELPVECDLKGVSALAGDSVYAVGGDDKTNSGVVLHYNGHTWSETFRAGGAGFFYNIWGNDANGLFAVGGYAEGMLQQGTVYSTRDGFWTESYSSSAMGTLFSVWGNGEGDVFAVGGGVGLGTVSGTLLGYNGSEWESVYTQFSGGWFYDVCGMGRDRLFAVSGVYDPLLEPPLKSAVLMSSNNGLSWHETHVVTGVFLLDLWSDETVIYAVGGNIAERNGGTVLYSTDRGDAWTEMEIDAQQYCLNAVWGDMNGNVYAVGGSSLEGVVFRLQESKWVRMAYGMRPLYGIGGDGAEKVYAVGDETILIYRQ